AAERHRLGDEAAQRRDALLDRRAGDERFRRIGRQAPAQLGPEALVGPLVDLLREPALQGVAAARPAALAAEREAALVGDVDQLVRYRRRVGKHAQPAERIVLFVDAQLLGRNAGAADAVEAVAAGDEVALQRFLAEGDFRAA